MIYPDATVTNCDLGENVQLLDNATFVNADLDRTVVFPGATTVDVTVRNSLVDREGAVRGVDLDGSIVGSRTVIQSKEPTRNRSTGTGSLRLTDSALDPE